MRLVRLAHLESEITFCLWTFAKHLFGRVVTVTMLTRINNSHVSYEVCCITVTVDNIETKVNWGAQGAYLTRNVSYSGRVSHEYSVWNDTKFILHQARISITFVYWTLCHLILYILILVYWLTVLIFVSTYTGWFLFLVRLCLVYHIGSLLRTFFEMSSSLSSILVGCFQITIFWMNFQYIFLSL